MQITIDEAIEKSKTKKNISTGGSACYDFGDVILVKYTFPMEYVRHGHRARKNQENVMQGINEKNQQGINTPKHLAMKRVIEGENDVCYVLQEKCKGKNCASLAEYGAPLEKVLKELEYVNKIPFKQYEKLVYDSCMLLEMGYEAKNKNLFYDEKTGFWFIDFLDNREEDKFDFNDPKKIFKAIKYASPKPLQIASCLSYDAKISKEDSQKVEKLKYASTAKYFLACKKVIPLFNKYEYFYLLDSSDNFKKYLMEMKLIDRDLFSATADDFKVYNELFTCVVNDICEEISKKGKKYWDVETNSIRNQSQLFNIESFYRKYICKEIKPEDYKEKWEYESTVSKIYTDNMMNEIYKVLKSMEQNDNISNFISEYNEEHKNRSFHK